ncbi:hypothetical protein [Paraburkholderia diazotrophica]|uniref:hypothetical protein n=1 Tax=Paraburkholderia diazotrophica TaxID=667676 RepID=UPI0015A636E4|nr:hypothetical protein [Paraburkholderia diazotrophica]
MMPQNFGTKDRPIVDPGLAVRAIETLGIGLLHRRTSVDVNTESLAESRPAESIVAIDPYGVATARHRNFVAIDLDIFVLHAYVLPD